jgi:hypothetical protein
MSRFDEAEEVVNQYGFEEAVYVLADQWGESTYKVRKYLESVEESFGYSIFDDARYEPDEYQEWVDFDPDC